MSFDRKVADFMNKRWTPEQLRRADDTVKGFLFWWWMWRLFVFTVFIALVIRFM